MSNVIGMDDNAGAADQQVEAIAKGARLKLASARHRIHILSAVFRGLDQWDTLVATMRASESTVQARQHLAELLGLDEDQASAVTGITMTMLTQRHRRLMAADYDRQQGTITELDSVVQSPERLRDLVGTERGNYLAGYGGE